MKHTEQVLTEMQKQYIVLVNEVNERKYITYRSNFEEQDECKTYSNHGQINNCEDSGCYSFSNQLSVIFDDFEDELTADGVNLNELSIHILVAMLEDGDQPDELNNEDWEKVKELYNEYLSKQNHSQVTAYTFWNGSNWKSITLYSEYYGETDVREAVNSKEILDEMPETPMMEGATATVETENFTYYFSRYASNPWICEVE